MMCPIMITHTDWSTVLVESSLIISSQKIACPRRRHVCSSGRLSLPWHMSTVRATLTEIWNRWVIQHAASAVSSKLLFFFVCFFFLIDLWFCNNNVFETQENLLIDEDHNLKLIDFGLCAKPKVLWAWFIVLNWLPSLGMKITTLNNMQFYFLQF